MNNDSKAAWLMGFTLVLFCATVLAIGVSFKTSHVELPVATVLASLPETPKPSEAELEAEYKAVLKESHEAHEEWMGKYKETCTIQDAIDKTGDVDAALELAKKYDQTSIEERRCWVKYKKTLDRRLEILTTLLAMKEDKLRRIVK